MKANDRFRKACKSFNYEPDIQFFPEGTKTASDAAAAVGCDVSQIVKSLVFTADNGAVLLLVSGKNRVSENKIKKILNLTAITMAAPKVVQSHTGFAIGGTPPFGHTQKIQTLMDEDLTAFDEVWAAAGTPNSCFPISPDDLLQISSATLAEVKLDKK
ncbi:MAG: aminoacyl-tRNA deacylase [Acidimicrobiaceae bacterium]|nr:aminoacyl-tRNA deacylase [Acidimicrobiaceae bacterium]